MVKDVRKALGTFWLTQFLQGVIFEDFDEKHGFPGFPKTSIGQFTAQLREAFCFFTCCALLSSQCCS